MLLAAAVHEVHRSDEREPDRGDEHCDPSGRVQGKNDQAGGEEGQHNPAHGDATRHLVDGLVVELRALVAVHDVADDDE